MTHSKLDKAIDEILVFPQPGESYDDYMDVHLLDGELMCYHITEQGKKKLKQALLEAFEQSLPAEKTTIKEMIKTEFVPEDDEEYMVTNNDFKAYGISARVHSWNAYRNEAIKVIRGNNE